MNYKIMLMRYAKTTRKATVILSQSFDTESEARDAMERIYFEPTIEQTYFAELTYWKGQKGVVLASLHYSKELDKHIISKGRKVSIADSEADFLEWLKFNSI